MNYIHTFDKKAEQIAYYNGPDYKEPCLSYERETKTVNFNEKNDYSKAYLTFEALENCKIEFVSPEQDLGNLYFSTDEGTTWTNYLELMDGIQISTGDKVMLKGELEPSIGIGNFTSTGGFNAMGNPCSLIYGDGFATATTLPAMALAGLFAGNTSLISTENLSLPVKTLSQGSYMGMFASCSSLENAPKLPATTLGEACYQSMFRDCTSLTVAPSLPATTLASGCYEGMFNGCTSLTTPPSILPATTLASGCYYQMFDGCTSLASAPSLPAMSVEYRCYGLMFSDCSSLTEAPELPATSLASYCYDAMFSGCTSLTVAPELPATTLSSHCYEGMFDGCTGLTTAPDLPATTLVDTCYDMMFYNCTSLTTAPELKAQTLVDDCYNRMFNGCSSLNYIKMLATGISAPRCLEEWVSGVAASGTFVKDSSMTTLPSGTSGIPTGWTVQDA